MRDLIIILLLLGLFIFTGALLDLTGRGRDKLLNLSLVILGFSMMAIAVWLGYRIAT